MTTSLLIICGVALGFILVVLLRELLLMVWKEGFAAGKKAEMESWAKCAEEADEAVREMGRRS